MAGDQPTGVKRAAIIRGDVTSTGIVLMVCAGALLLLAALKVVQGWIWLALAGVLVVAGLLMFRWGKARYSELIQAVVDAHGSEGPLRSPVAWVSDELWDQKNRFDPALDAPGILRAEVEPGYKAFGHDATGAFKEPVLRPVAPEERELAAEHEVAADLEVPPKGSKEDHIERILSTPGRFIALAPRWPICCGRLTTMVAIQEHLRPAGSMFLDATVRTEDSDPGMQQGIHSYACRACGRRYSTNPAW